MPKGYFFTFGKAEYFTVRKAKDFTKGVEESIAGRAQAVKIALLAHFPLAENP